MDFFLSLGAIIVFSPLFLIIAAAIKIDSRGPVIFQQKRIGFAQTDFYIFKFRSMVQNASQIGEAFTSQGDRRITKIGLFLRNTSIDELPQIFNVLRGDMSFIGPRPDVHELAHFDDPFYNKRFEVRPGITGMAQVYGRSEISYESRCEMDARYVDGMTFLLDVKLLLATIPAILLRRGVN